MKTDKNYMLIFLFLIFIIFFLFESCVNMIPWKTKFFIGKWILPLNDTYYTIEFKKDGTFITRGRKFCNLGSYKIMNHEKNSALLKLNSVSENFNTTLLVLRYKEGLYIKLANYSRLWYSIKSEKGKLIIENATKNINNIYQLETWDHYYLISFPALNKKESDLLLELENPDFIENLKNQKIYYYKTKGEDENGNIYNYKFYILNGTVIRVESEISVKAILN
ncbi:MAG: hypothetical protein ACK4YF_06645 [Exilispira sp.]